MGQGKTRIKDIARMAGVSIGTVDRVIHDREGVAPLTREKIRHILDETNYSPDVTARMLKSGKDLHLVSLLPAPVDDNKFWEKHPQGIDRAIGELDLYRVSITRLNFDMQNEEDFQKKSREILALGPDGVILAPIFKNESITFCSSLRERNIPFVFVDGFIENTGFLAYIGEDAFRSGRIAGQLADLVTPEGKDILLVSIARNIANVQHLNNRMRGFQSYFENAGRSGKRLIASIPDSSPSMIGKYLGRALDDNRGVSTIYMSGSRSYLIAAALEGMGIRNISVIGYDLLGENISCLRNGKIRFLLSQRPEEQTFRAVKKLSDFLSLQRQPENMEYLPVDIITSENADFFV